MNQPQVYTCSFPPKPCSHLPPHTTPLVVTEHRDQIANILWIIEKAREFQKNMYFCFINYAKAFVWITINYGKL